MTLPAASAAIAPRIKISEKDLSDKVLQMLRSMPACVDARSVMLELSGTSDGTGNWRINHFNAGCGDRYTCKVACRNIQTSLGEMFEMVA